MISLLEKTAWTFKNKPTSYGLFHILFTVVGVAVVVLMAILLRKSSKKTFSRILFWLGVLLLIMEVYKLSFRYFITYNQNFSSWLWLFPFQLCSVPMYIALVLPLIKNTKLENNIYVFLATFTLSTSAITFIEPSGLLHSEITLTIHAFLWHLIILFIGLYTAANKNVCKNMKEFFGGALVFLVLAITANIINLSLTHLGHINLFYISPLAISPIVIFNSIQTNFGYFIFIVSYLLAIIAISFITFYIIHLFKNKKSIQKIKPNN